MKIALVGPELEENLGLRYIASSLKKRGHTADIVPFNDASDIDEVVGTVLATAPDITGLSMVFTSRGREFCALATALRHAGYRGRIASLAGTAGHDALSGRRPRRTGRDGSNLYCLLLAPKAVVACECVKPRSGIA